MNDRYYGIIRASDGYVLPIRVTSDGLEVLAKGYKVTAKFRNELDLNWHILEQTEKRKEEHQKQRKSHS